MASSEQGSTERGRPMGEFLARRQFLSRLWKLGGGLIAMMNRIGYDALVPGNHMFDHSLTNMVALEKAASFPFLYANLAKDGDPLGFWPYFMFDFRGLTVGVIGVTYHPMVGMVPEPNLEGYVSEDPWTAIAKHLPAVDSQTDLIILLSHAGLREDQAIARRASGVLPV